MEACPLRPLVDPSFASCRPGSTFSLSKQGCFHKQLVRPLFVAPICLPFRYVPERRHRCTDFIGKVLSSPCTANWNITGRRSSVNRRTFTKARNTVCSAANEPHAAPSDCIDLEMEIFRFMETSGKPDVFPSRLELLRGGRSDLVEAIESQGGWLSVGWDDEADESVAAVLGSSVPSLGSDKGFDMNEFWGGFTQQSGPIHADTSATLKGTHWSSEASRLAELVGNADQGLDKPSSKPSSEPGYKGREAAPLGGVMGVDFSRGLQNLPSIGGVKRPPPKTSSDFYSQLDSVTNNLLAGLGLGYASPPLVEGDNEKSAILQQGLDELKGLVEGLQTLDVVFPAGGVETPGPGATLEDVAFGGSNEEGLGTTVEDLLKSSVEVEDLLKSLVKGDTGTNVEVTSETMLEVTSEYVVVDTPETIEEGLFDTTEVETPKAATKGLSGTAVEDTPETTMEDVSKTIVEVTLETTVEEPDNIEEGIVEPAREETPESPVGETGRFSTESDGGEKREQGEKAESFPAGTSGAAGSQTSTSHQGRPPNHWRDPDNLWRELRSAQAELGLADDIMPNRRQLVRLNRHDLVRAVRRQGGFRRMAARLRPGLGSGLGPVLGPGSGMAYSSESESESDSEMGSGFGSNSGTASGPRPWLRPGSRPGSKRRPRAGSGSAGVATKEVQMEEPKAAMIVEPVAEPMSEPIAPIRKPVAEPIREPIVEPIAEPIEEPAPPSEPALEPEPQQSPFSRLLNAFGFGPKPETVVPPLEPDIPAAEFALPDPEAAVLDPGSALTSPDPVPVSYLTETERKAAEEERKALDEQQVAQRLRDSLAPSFWKRKSGRRRGEREGGLESGQAEGGNGRANPEDIVGYEKAEGIPGGTARGDEHREAESGLGPSSSGSPAVIGDNAGLLARIRELEMNLAATREALQHDREALFENRESLREIRTSTLQELSKVSDSLEFREDEFQKTQRSLRRTQAEMRVLEARENLGVPEAVVEIPEPQNPEDFFPAPFLRMVRVVWPHEGQEVEVTGSFNGWDKVKMEKSNAGVFIATLNLPPGQYEMKFVVDGVWKVDAQRLITYEGGNENNVINVF